ncbi:MAG: GNAT family N-acetyltransferase [Acidobacteriota bacterium]
MLETKRLIIRKMTVEDLSWLIESRSDPQMYKYLGGLERQNPDAVTRRMDFYLECYEKFGFGQCAMIWKATGERVGCSGLQPLEQTGEIEVGYSVIPEFWRMGIGYECAYAWLEYGFDQSGLERVVAVADEENTGSWRIMQKCGMKFEGIQEHYGMPVVFYSVSKEEFNKLRSMS